MENQKKIILKNLFFIKNKLALIILGVSLLLSIVAIVFFINLQKTIDFQEYQLRRLLGLSNESGVNIPPLNSREREELNTLVDFSNLQKMIDASTTTVQQVYDYEEKINICNNVIIAIDNFIRDSRNIDLNNAAEKSQSDWISKRNEYQSALESLNNDLHKRMYAKAIAASNKHRRFSDIEKIELLNNEITKRENKINYERLYNVRMKGFFFDPDISKFTITVTGYIDMLNNSIVVNEKVEIGE